ncbi:YiiX/YebB-like N1pC/P60 family cysteine hydrolase [Brevibacillus sp. NRS-1366]|uniref:YiiX/YebB-like N1pC/P60 family cysteine hydrolase n=1 Tax=Brevibacillus sp. NRS-1366 TaxID=3233899 RepID=UPI003D20F21D
MELGVYEALPRPGVVHQFATKYWSTVDDESQYYVKDAEDADYKMAVAYAKSQVGDSYGLETTLSNSSVWYCSKLVYKAWKDAGFSIGSLDEYAGVVLPSSLIIDVDTVS